jgi:hypothetical protein
MGYTLFFLALFGIALGFFEAGVVVYLRQIYYPGAPLFPMQEIPLPILKVEILREFFSIVLIWSAAVLAGKTRALRIASFFIIFGVWDIFYYIFLKLFLDWPAAWTDWDILFLIPAPWLSPVLAPILCSITLILFGLEMHRLWAKGFPMPIMRADLLAACAASVPILISFFWETGTALRGELPMRFPWPLFLLGLALALGWAVKRRGQIKRFEST